MFYERGLAICHPFYFMLFKELVSRVGIFSTGAILMSGFVVNQMKITLQRAD